MSDEPSTLGVFTRRSTCLACDSHALHSFLDFGNVPLAGDFRSPAEAHRTKLYPMDLAVCDNCSLVQIPNVVDPHVIFTDYRYLSSVTSTLSEYRDNTTTSGNKA